MKQVSLIAAISMAVLAFFDLLDLFIGYIFINWITVLFTLIKVAAKCGVGYFFLTLYKKQN